jgi:hypothetical protein
MAKITTKKTNVNLYTPHAKQQALHRACVDPSIFFITVIAGRQAGKSAAALNQAVYWGLKDSGSIVYWVSPTNSQTNKIYKQILNGLANTPFLKSNKGSVGDTEIVLTNGSVIKFRSAAQEDSLRGESVNYMILDEGAFIKQSTFQEILLPMLNVAGKKCLIVTTPKGKNWVFNQYMKGKTNTKKYKSFKFVSTDNPYSNPEVIEMAEASLPKELFEQEYLAEFVDSAAVFTNINELANVKMIDKPVAGDKYWAGIDLALKNDYTVISLMNQKNEVVFYDRFNNVTAPQLKERLMKTLHLFKPEKTMIELNNLGQSIYDDLKHTHKIPNLVGFNTTTKSKPEIINHLINAFGSKKLTILNDETYKDELKVFAMHITPSGTVKFEAPNGMNDDIPMSLAITWECLNKYKYNNTVAFT